MYFNFFFCFFAWYSYCLKCRKITESKSPKVVKTKNERIMLLSKCAVCDSKKSKFIQEQEGIKNKDKDRNEDTFKWNSFSWSSFVLIVLNKLMQGIKWMK